MPERLSDLGYLAIKKETTKGTAVTPNVFLPLYNETLGTNVNLDDDMPIIGNKAARLQTVQGQRSHTGTLNVAGEPNTAGYMFDMLLNKVSTSGAGPYTHTFALNGTDPNSYTVDLLKGQVVFRYIGVEARQIAPSFNANKMELGVEVTARKEFSIRELSGTPTGSNPYTIALKTNFDPSPTTGLVVGDVMRLFKADGTTIDFTVATVASATTITTITNVTTGAAGDYVGLRAQTPSYTIQPPFLWSGTEFRFGASAAAAVSATHTGVETGSDWTITHGILPDEGAHRSGSLDPASLPRGNGDVAIKVKRFFDTPEEHNRFLTVGTRALVIRHFGAAVSATNQELRITANELPQGTSTKPLSKGEIIYDNIEYKANYSQGDAQAFGVVVINNVSSI